MKNVWVLVCDSANARLFETRGNGGPLKVLDVLTHPGSRGKAADLVEGRLGQRSSLGPSVHHNALAPSSSPQENEKSQFGHTLATMLDESLRTRRFDLLVLVASPQFLGILKNELTPQLHKHLFASLDKDFTHLDVAELQTRLHDTLRLPPE